MKWFKNLLDNADENSKKRMNEGIGSFEPLKEVIEKEEEQKEEPKQKQKPEPEMIDVEIDGKYSYKVEKYKNGLDENSQRIRFDYKVVAKFLEHETEIESSVFEYQNYVSIHSGGYGFRMMNEQELYERLLELLTEKREQMMELITNDIATKINEYIKQNNIDKIKEAIKEGQEVDFNFTFRMEKPKNA